MMDSVLQDLRYALRTLRRTPVFTLIAVLTLATAIGANTVIFSVLNGVLLRPLQYDASDRLFGIWERSERGDYRLGSYPTFRDWRAQSNVFEALAYIRGSSSLIPSNDGTRRVGTAFVSDEFFAVLRGPPLIGRLFSPEEQRPGGPPVAVLTYELWRDVFGGDRAAVGSTIQLNEVPYTIIGVLPPWFRFPSWASVYVPLSTILATDRILTQRGFHADSRIVAKLKPHVSPQQAQASMASIQARLATAYAAENRGWTQVELVSLFEQELSFGAVRPILILLCAAVATVLLLACANVANMSLVRAATRSRELAVRAALGAGRGRVARLLFTESAVLVLAGGLIGLLLAFCAIGLVRAAAPGGLPRANEIVIDARMLGFTALICLLVTVAVGVAPAMRTPTADLSVPLKAGSPGAGASGIWLRLRSALVALEVALALVLLIGTGLLVRSLWALSHVDPGFDPKGVITFGVFPPPRYDAAERAVDLYQRVASAIASLPGAGEVALSNHVPLSGAYLPRPIEVPGRSPDPQGDPPVLFRTISAEYFDVMRIPVRKGRAFTAADIALGSRMAIINETLAHRFFPGQNPIGKFVTLFKSAQSRKDFGERFSVEIIGVIGDVRHTSLEEAPAPEVYIPYTVNPWGQMNVVVRTRGDPQAVLGAIPRAVAAVDRDVPVTGPQRPGALTQAVSGQWARQRFTVTVLSGFAGGALLLAALGIFGVIAYVVTLRTREFGVRAALGATPRDIVRLVIRQTTGVVVVGLVVGFGAALAVTRLMTRLLYNVPATDPLTFASLTVFLAVVALVASYLPARRATRVDPMIALRNE